MILEVVYTTPKEFKIGAEAIKWYLDTDYSHVAIRWYSDTYKRYMVYHAAHGTVHFVSDDLFVQNNVIVHTDMIELSNEQFNKVISKCIDLAGLPYGYSELINILYGDINHRITGTWIQSGDGKGYICSELLAVILDMLNIKICKPKHLINPKDIYEVLNG